MKKINQLERQNQRPSQAFFKQLKSKQINIVLLFLFVLLLPSQFGKHFFFDFSYVFGVRIDYLAPTLYLTDVLLVALLCLNFSFIKKNFKNRKILLLISLLLINVAFSANKIISIYRCFKILQVIIIYLLFRKYRPGAFFFLVALLAGAFLELFLSSMQLITGRSLQGIFYLLGERRFSLSTVGIAKVSLKGVEILRPYGTFSHPNSLSGFFLLLYFFVLTKKSFSFWPALKKVFLATAGLLIFFSFSKVAILTFLLLNLIFLIMSLAGKTCKLCLFSQMFILVMLSLIFLAAKGDVLHLHKRVILIKNSLDIIRQHPLFGVGLGNYLVAQSSLPSPYLAFFNQPVHNIYLLALAELGLPIAFLSFLIILGRLRLLLYEAPYVLVSFLITGFFDHYWLTLQQNLFLLGVLFGSL